MMQRSDFNSAPLTWRSEAETGRICNWGRPSQKIPTAKCLPVTSRHDISSLVTGWDWARTLLQMEMLCRPGSLLGILLTLVTFVESLSLQLARPKQLSYRLSTHFPSISPSISHCFHFEWLSGSLGNLSASQPLLLYTGSSPAKRILQRWRRCRLVSAWCSGLSCDQALWVLKCFIRLQCYGPLRSKSPTFLAASQSHPHHSSRGKWM